MLLVEEICDQFEDQLRIGSSRPITSYVENASSLSRRALDKLIRSLLLIEWDYRLQRSDQPCLEEFAFNRAEPPIQF